MTTETTLLATLVAACDTLAAAAREQAAPERMERLEDAAGDVLAALEGLVNVSGGLTLAGINRALEHRRSTALPPALAAKDDYWRLALAPVDRPRHG